MPGRAPVTCFCSLLLVGCMASPTVGPPFGTAGAGPVGGAGGGAGPGGTGGTGGVSGNGGTSAGGTSSGGTGGEHDAGRSSGGTGAVRDGGAPANPDAGQRPCTELGDAGTRAPPHPGTIATYTAVTPYQSGAQSIRVLLPGSFTPEKHYRALYVLPVETGTGGLFGDGLGVLQSIGAQDQYDLILVSMTFAVEPWFGDHASDPQIRQAAYLKEYVVPFVERSYPVCAEARSRLLIGFSKSGWGAFSLILRSPDVFGYAAAWDSPLMISTFQFGMQQVFGTQAQLDLFRPDLTASAVASDFQGEPRLVLTGQSVWGTQVSAYHDLLVGLGIQHDYDLNVPALHSWNAQWVAPTLAKLMAVAR